MRETWVRSLGWKDALEKKKATHSSILAWRIPQTVKSMGSQRVRHDWVPFTSLHFYRNLLVKYPATLTLLPSQNLQNRHFSKVKSMRFSLGLGFLPEFPISGKGTAIQPVLQLVIPEVTVYSTLPNHTQTHTHTHTHTHSSRLRVSKKDSNKFLKTNNSNPDARKVWRQKEKRAAEDKLVR